MNTLGYITSKYNLSLEGNLPIEIPNIGRSSWLTTLRELNFKSGVEVGVAEGLYSMELNHTPHSQN